MSYKPQIILVDDHLLFRQSLKSIIIAESIAKIIGEASNGLEFIELLSQLKPDLVLMDIDMPFMDGIEATKKALKLVPDLKIIAFTMYSNKEFIARMTDLGVKGFISKTCSIQELEKAIIEVVVGKNYLSKDIPRKITKISGYKSAIKPRDK